MEDMINIREYISMIKRRKWLILLILVLSVGVGVFKTYRNNKAYVPMYVANTKIRVNVAKSNPGVGLSPATTSQNQNISNTYINLATSKATLNEIKNTVGLETPPSGLISAVPEEANTEFINVTVTHTNPKTAQKIADAFPTAFNNELIRMIGIDCIDVIEKAETPKVPIPKPSDKSIIKFGIVGVVLAIFAVLLLEFMDNKITTPKDVEDNWGLPLLGVVPYDDPKEQKKRNKKINKKQNGLEVN